MKIKNLNNSVTLADLLFNVEKIENTDFACNSDYQFDVFAYPTIAGIETKLRVNSCSKRYELVNNSLIFPVVEQIFRNYNIAYSVEYDMVNHARFYVKYTIEDTRYAYNIKGTNDTVKPMLIVQHSYNGLTKYKIMFGYFRLVCTNGLTIALAEMKEFNLSIVGKHTKTILNSLKRLNDIISVFAIDAKNICNAITAKYDLLAESVPANVTDRINAALKVAGIIPIDNKSINTLNHIIMKAEKDANNVDLGYKGTVNDWLIYNAINNYLFDSTLNSASFEKRSDKDSKVFEYLLKTV